LDISSKIYVAGHKGLVGSAIVRKLTASGYKNILTADKIRLNLIDQRATADFFENEKPDYVFLAAAKVGGILANNNYPADFIYDNTMIESNIIHSSFKTGVKKLLFLGSSCIYPKLANQPIKEEYLLEGKLEPTNEPYAIAKILGIKLCQSFNRQYGTNYISVMPTNLYGYNDNFDLNNSHVLPALIRKFHEAKQNAQESVTLWGTGAPYREFLFVEDLADACVFLMNNYNETEIVNVGTGSDISIKDLAELIKKIIGYKGNIEWDSSKPDGTPKKLLDVSKLSGLGWESTTSLEKGIQLTYNWYLNNRT
jgi:GDP-L-fucose synthase